MLPKPADLVPVKRYRQMVPIAIENCTLLAIENVRRFGLYREGSGATDEGRTGGTMGTFMACFPRLATYIFGPVLPV